MLLWTEEMDEILITNFPQFKDLEKRACFELLSALIPGSVSSRQAFERAKKLKLKKLSED